MSIVWILAILVGIAIAFRCNSSGSSLYLQSSRHCKGFSTIEDVSGWTEKNVRRLHLVAGIVLFFLGIAMLLGLV